METSQYLHSHIPNIPMEYDQSNLPFPPNYNFLDDGYMDALFGADDESWLCDTFIGTEEALVVDPLQQESHNFSELSLTDLLLVGAEAVEAENWHLASAAISQLDQVLFDLDGNTSPFLRLAYFFTQGLRLRALGPWLQPPMPESPSPTENMSPYQMVQELSPYVKFAHFTANQAILEASAGDREVHVLDLDVMEGLQWPPLMVDLARRDGASLRITAIVTDDNANDVCRTARRLIEFAESIGLVLRIDRVDEGSLDELEFDKGSVIANCTSVGRSFASVRKFVDGARKLSAKMVVLVQEELLSATKSTNVSFVEFFCEALHHFSSVTDSLVSSFSGGYSRGLRAVEEEMLGPRIVDYVSRFGCGSLSLEGFRIVPLSPRNVSQAKLLVGLFSRGYGVQHDKGRLALCWKSRPLTTVSIWAPSFDGEA